MMKNLMKNLMNLMMKKRYILILLIILSVISVIASSIQFRQYPTHQIVKQVNCISCHSYEFEELKNGDHIRMMGKTQNKTLYDYISLYGDNSTAINVTNSLAGPCYSCHMTYANFYRFGLTDPYAYVIGNIAYTVDGQTQNVDLVDAQYGYIIDWPGGNSSTIYFNNSNSSIHIELDVLDVTPTNFTVDSTIKVVLANYSGQGGNLAIDYSQILNKGDKQVLDTSISDYFKIILILDGLWNTTLLNLRVNGTDKGLESFYIIANSNIKPFVYELPYSATGVLYFRTNNSYKAVRLDYILGEWANYAMGNIASSEVIETEVWGIGNMGVWGIGNVATDGWIRSNTCSAPDAMCHINQKTTSMGLSDGINPDKSFYTHKLSYTTTTQCDICHLNNKILVKTNRRSTTPP